MKNFGDKVKAKELVVFDLDGTLAESKSPMDRAMSRLFARLLAAKKVAVIGGGKYSLFREQLLEKLSGPSALFRNLFLFPTTSTAFYRYAKHWTKVYEHVLAPAEKKKVKSAIAEALRELEYIPPPRTYGPVIEDRGSQISFSPLGQEVVAALGEKKGVAAKEEWNRKYHKSVRVKMVRLLQKKLPEFEVRSGGLTTVDVTKKGIDKAFGLRQIETYLKIPIKKMLFVGDAIYPGGNDYAALKTGVDYVKVAGPSETKKVIGAIVG